VNRNTPESLDWVRERAACMPLTVFEALREHVEKDMKARNALLPTAGFTEKHFVFEGKDGWFSVTQIILGQNRYGVMFRITPNGVQVEGISRPDIGFSAILTLSDDGKCRLRVGDTEYNLWQFRKLALHDLFFVE
jgi:hypothetical protein